MRAALTKAAIGAYAKALATEGAQQPASNLENLLAVFHGFASKPITELVAFLDTIDPVQVDVSQAANPESTLSSVINSLKNLENLLGACSTPNRMNDLVALGISLRKHESATIVAFLQAVKSGRRRKLDGGAMDPAALARKLKDALGDEERFAPLFEELSNLDAATVASVAQELMSAGSSKTRKKDLSRIRDRHEALRTLNAKERASGGRSAA